VKFISRDKVLEQNNTRNAGVRKVMACLHICNSEPPEEYDVERPLKDTDYFAAHDHCLTALGRASRAPLNWNNKSAADTSAQAWAYHYYVFCSTFCTVAFCTVIVFCSVAVVLLSLSAKAAVSYQNSAVFCVACRVVS
jgi:hypothetical protein